MRALLEREFAGAGLSFAEWTVLVFTHASPLPAEQVVERHLAGHVVSGEAESRRAIARLLAAGLISEDPGGGLRPSESGGIAFGRLKGAVDEITRSLYGDLPLADLEATHRTLTEIARRAGELLSSDH